MEKASQGPFASYVNESRNLIFLRQAQSVAVLDYALLE